ncbi:MAG: hypothetical protein GEU98_15745 [Pseudonocardiaceae bacterium]|nr:hypothetical protein [Pseudonocardiaceae bacterium]
MYGGQWSEQLTVPQFAATLAAFLALMVLLAHGGRLLWTGRRSGAVLVVATIPIEALFWFGYALPIPPVLALLRVVLVAAGWRSLNPQAPRLR